MVVLFLELADRRRCGCYNLPSAIYSRDRLRMGPGGHKQLADERLGLGAVYGNVHVDW
jgi:hypothetical protein